MKNALVRIALSALLVSTLSITTASAAWGKPRTTPTESANADMKLGDYKGLKHAIGCKDFANEAGWRGQWDIGNNLTAMLESALYDTGRFVIVEREKLKDVIAEQDLAASGRTAAAKKVAQTGLIRSARYLATGVVSEVEDAQAGGGGGVSIKGFRVGGARSQAQVAIIVKLVDTTTGEIVAKERVVGRPTATGLNVGYSGSTWGGDLGGFQKTPLGQAAQDAINQAASIIAKKMETFPFEGSVVKVTDKGQIIINRGSEFGVESGQVLLLQEEGEQLIDPDTGEILDQEEGDVVGKVRVAKVSEKVSYCDVVEGEKNPPPGTIVTAGR
jgi:curli biogenesis system outer membrane secretion channel CsgG